jgi:hypothetical protein
MEYVIIVGCPRSGTTYLTRLLDSLRGTECISGLLLTASEMHVASQDLSEQEYNALAVGFRQKIQNYLNGTYHSRLKALQKFFKAPTGEWNRLLRSLRHDRPMPEYFVYKEPFISFDPGLVARAIPNAKFIHLVRDGRDCANSLVNSYDVLTDDELTGLESAEMLIGRQHDHRYVPWWVEDGNEKTFLEASPYVRSIWMWTYMVERCDQYFEELEDDGQVLQVKYEQFMRNPRDTGEQILEYLDTGGTQAFQQQLGQARTSSIGKHTQRPREEIDAAVDVAQEALAAYGYV